ncbi:putative serine/threonine-protein kinase [Senna tora]|uniref:Putative serine/threonine-protein kinase n=1 Tax=Senna tora TaxID=362788 RepID=A0A834VZL9_9FABA|nr:putative serine/threonine-protein kinase [Senna tora]
MSCGCFGASTTKRKRSSTDNSHDIDDNALDNVKSFSDKELRLATDNYDSRNKIGRGGFGTVYQEYCCLQTPFSILSFTLNIIFKVPFVMQVPNWDDLSI